MRGTGLNIGQKIFCIFFIILECSVINECAFCKFTNVICHSFDKTAIVFKRCYIKAAGRDDNYLVIHAVLKEPVRSGNCSIRLLKRANGWKPFLYSVKFEICKFMKNPRANPLGEFFYNIMKEYTNINHSCPYENDVIMDKFRLTKGDVKLPFPVGEYAVDTEWVLNGKLSARVNGSCIGDGDL